MKSFVEIYCDMHYSEMPGATATVLDYFHLRCRVTAPCVTLAQYLRATHRDGEEFRSLFPDFTSFRDLSYSFNFFLLPQIITTFCSKLRRNLAFSESLIPCTFYLFFIRQNFLFSFSHDLGALHYLICLFYPLLSG